MTVLNYERRGHVALITFNRPEVRNAINPELSVRLDEAWRQVRDDAQVRVAVLTGAGAAFCAGADLGRLIPLFSGARQPEDEWDERLLADPRTTSRALLRNFDPEKPVIAAINGHAIAGGMEIVQGTDIRVAAPAAKFGVQEVKWAIFPAGGSHCAHAHADAVRQGHGTAADRRSHHRAGRAQLGIPELCGGGTLGQGHGNRREDRRQRPHRGAGHTPLRPRLLGDARTGGVESRNQALRASVSNGGRQGRAARVYGEAPTELPRPLAQPPPGRPHQP